MARTPRKEREKPAGHNGFSRKACRRLTVLTGAILLASITVATASASPRLRPSHANPSAEVSALARVEKPPRRTTHRNGRSFEQLTVLLLSVDPRRPPSGEFEFDMGSPVRIVHDLSCGGTWVDLARGDLVDVKGEYVHASGSGGGGGGRDLIHFTHPADGRCGRAEGHPDGYFRRHREPAAASAPPARDPALLIADFRSTVRPILAARCAPCHEAGGQMYARLPFDDPRTVATHFARMARRLKNDEERRALESWAAFAATLPAQSALPAPGRSGKPGA